jgi:hypothetical protein
MSEFRRTSSPIATRKASLTAAATHDFGSSAADVSTRTADSSPGSSSDEDDWEKVEVKEQAANDDDNANIKRVATPCVNRAASLLVSIAAVHFVAGIEGRAPVTEFENWDFEPWRIELYRWISNYLSTVFDFVCIGM